MTTPPLLTADCANCTALCCMALSFDAGEALAIDKPACAACPNLNADFTCSIHDRLETQGFSGCVRYDCLGAGQRVTNEVFKGRDWRNTPALMAPMVEAFAAMRSVHRNLELLLAAQTLALPAPIKDILRDLLDIHLPADGWTADTLAAYAAAGHDQRVAAFLRDLRAYV